jgi:dTDP-4-dehydrorhamnose reductase
MPPKYLIIGASGFIGTHLFAMLGPQHAVATYRSHAFPGGVPFDAVRTRLSATLLKSKRDFTHAFIFHGITKIDACASDPEGTARINVESVRHVIDDLIDHEIIPIFASSDAVFDGSRGLWAENDPANPVLTYGRHKIMIEQYLREKSTAAIVVRIAKVVGTAAKSPDILGEWINQLEAGATIRCASDQIFSPADVDDVNRALVQLAENNCNGLFHVCGPQPISRLELLQALAREVEKHHRITAKIIPCSIRDFNFSEPRPLDTSMSPQKLYSTLNIRFKSPQEICRLRAINEYALARR